MSTFPRVTSGLLACIMTLSCPIASLRAAVPVAQTSSDAREVNFSFDQADLRLIIKIVGEITGRRFVIDESVKGSVTVVTPDNIQVREVYPLLISILENSGYTVLEKEEGTHVVPLPEGKAFSGRVLIGDEKAEGLVTRVFRISHISSDELALLLSPLVRGGKEGAVASFSGTNHLLITDTSSSLRQIEKLIRDLDVPGASRNVEVIRLEHADADEVARQLISAMRGTETSAQRVSTHMQRVTSGMGNVPADMVVVPVPNANSIVAVGTPVQIGQVKDILARIDIEMPAEFGRLNAIFLKYMNAKEAAETLNALLAKTATKDNPPQIAIEHNAANNALIVEASPQDFELVRQLVNDLDRAPKQVMIEVIIAEVTMSEGFDLGVELSTIENFGGSAVSVSGRSRPGDSDVLSSILTEGITPQGIAIGVTKGSYVDAAGRVLPGVPLLLTALAQNRDVNILSEIPLMAQNNEEASFSVVDNIPILTSSIEGTGDNRDIIQNIERIDVGTKLKITPHINADNEVKLILNPSIEAIVDQGPSSTDFAPTIAKREVLTTVTVPNRATVVISGLIREDTVTEVSKIPFLGDIPLLGILFRSKSDRIVKTNLLILATPHIIDNLNDAEAVKEALERRTAIKADSSLTAPQGPED